MKNPSGALSSLWLEFYLLSALHNWVRSLSFLALLFATYAPQTALICWTWTWTYSANRQQCAAITRLFITFNFINLSNVQSRGPSLFTSTQYSKQASTGPSEMLSNVKCKPRHFPLNYQLVRGLSSDSSNIWGQSPPPSVADKTDWEMCSSDFLDTNLDPTHRMYVPTNGTALGLTDCAMVTRRVGSSSANLPAQRISAINKCLHAIEEHSSDFQNAGSCPASLAVTSIVQRPVCAAAVEPAWPGSQRSACAHHAMRQCGIPQQVKQHVQTQEPDRSLSCCIFIVTKWQRHQLVHTNRQFLAI